MVVVLSEVLVDGLAEGDRSSFDEFVRREFVPVLALALALLRDEQDAVEVAQETMARAFERWGDVAVLDRPGAWTRRVALNLATDQLRSRSRRRRLLERLRAFGTSDGTATVADEWDERFWAEVAGLPPRQRSAVALHYVLDRPVAEIAEILEVPVGTVKSDLSRARARLAGRLQVER